MSSRELPLLMVNPRPRQSEHLHAVLRTLATGCPHRADARRDGLRWIQAEHRVPPKLLAAQTGYMQAAAGIGMWLLRLDAAENKRDTFIRCPDSPF